jgi:ABC-type Zn uptake system ZnuABC Zn-binding protein ZnuA
MAELIAADLKRLSPGHRNKIEENLDRLKRELLTLKARYEMDLIDAGAFSVIAFSSDFVYLTDDFAIDVEAYFLKEGYFWDDADAKALKKTIEESGVYVAVTGFKPNKKVSDALEDAGVTLVVLDTMDSNRPFDPESGGYTAVMVQNLKKLLEAFSAL